ncbi:MAG: TatD DNase family protein [Pseudohongiellaceae bacterium]|jgi:TatD DNase family protein
MTQATAQETQQIPLFDIGANLTSKRFAEDIKLVIANAQAAGIHKIVITGTNIVESEQAIILAQQFPGLLYSTVGIHPHDAKTLSIDSMSQIRDLSANSCVKAIGETGLDFNRNFSTPSQQIIAFEQHIEMAIETQLPLFLHERDAFMQQFEIIKLYRDKLVNAVIHCFTGSKQQCFKYLDLDLHIGITGWLCDPKRGEHLREFVSDIPLDRLMIETDAPYLLPKSVIKPVVIKKGRNEPCTLPYVLDAVCDLRGSHKAEIAEAIYGTSNRFFMI